MEENAYIIVRMEFSLQKKKKLRKSKKIVFFLFISSTNPWKKK